jgi:F-type H+-transporting ATPase subunit epsilon
MTTLERNMPIHCDIVSQDRSVFTGDADMVILPGTDGEMGILPNHAPLLSTLKYGILTVRYRGHDEVFTVAGGIVEVMPDQVSVLADAAENVAEIDVNRAEAARRRAEEQLKQGPPPDSDTFLAIEAALRRSNLRLEAAKRYRGGRRTPRSGMSGEGAG